jgi:hypothetical protein
MVLRRNAYATESFAEGRATKPPDLAMRMRGLETSTGSNADWLVVR